MARSELELEHAYALRRRVFCGEQGVSEEAEFDGLDDEATHIVGVDPGGVVLATCRLLFDAHWTCRLGRMAVAEGARRGGVGRRLLTAAEAEARGRGAREVALHAQRQAEPFYVACWYRAEGATFMEEGIPHVTMRKAILR